MNASAKPRVAAATLLLLAPASSGGGRLTVPRWSAPGEDGALAAARANAGSPGSRAAAGACPSGVSGRHSARARKARR